MEDVTGYVKETYVVLYVGVCNGPMEKFKKSFRG